MLNRIKNWFIRDDATAAVEFALVGFPFIIMLVGIVEMCLFFSTGVSLEGATQTAARMIRTGQIQALGTQAAELTAFENAVCSQVNQLVNCTWGPGGLQAQVLTIAGNDFANAAAMTPQYDAQGNLLNSGAANFQAGASNQDVLIRVVYQYTFLTPLLGNIITGSLASKAMLMSTVVIENEPYQFGG